MIGDSVVEAAIASRRTTTEKDGLTTVRLTHSGLTPEGLQAHQGWSQILVWLRGYVEH